MKYLGVIIDHKLIWYEHISYIKNKISKDLDIIFKSKNNFRPTMFTYYLQFICLSLPNLLYWNLGYSISNSFTTAILAQKKVVRILTLSH